MALNFANIIAKCGGFGLQNRENCALNIKFLTCFKLYKKTNIHTVIRPQEDF